MPRRRSWREPSPEVPRPGCGASAGDNAATDAVSARGEGHPTLYRLPRAGVEPGAFDDYHNGSAEFNGLLG
jgi:hypothetical protein